MQRRVVARSRSRRSPRVWGTAAAVHYYQLGLTLAHYDARAHLVVARRVFDSLTPGWQQVGAVWLPLPHLLNALPVQIDWFYRTGVSGDRDLDRVDGGGRVGDRDADPSRDRIVRRRRRRRRAADAQSRTCSTSRARR